MVQHIVPADQFRDAVALISGVLAEPEHDLDRLLETVLNDLRNTDPTDTVAAFAGIATHLLDELAKVTGTPRGELWQDSAVRISARLANKEINSE